MSSARITPRPDVTAEEARDTRASAWAYVFSCFDRHVNEKGGPETAPEDAKGPKHDRAETSLPQR